MRAGLGSTHPQPFVVNVTIPIPSEPNPPTAAATISKPKSRRKTNAKDKRELCGRRQRDWVAEALEIKQLFSRFVNTDYGGVSRGPASIIIVFVVVGKGLVS